MPFKLKLKKSRQYNVMSKNLFVICVEMLDGSIVDCTLSNQQSKGLECLENICQKISIQQPEFFGLRYVAKATKNGNEMEMRWVDLERPLNRQLEKYASSKTLYLRVMYYVISGVSLILDEVTRNYYFLQLKQDIVEGKISCDPKQAVILANYSRQAEYGNFRSDRHTVDYLKSLLSFPKHLIESGLLEALTEEVIKTHEELHNVTQAAAEELYISACQQLDGYGQETFIASGNDSLEVMLGISVSGIIVAGSCGTHKFYPWRDITNVVNHKKTFNIECTDQQKNLGFNLQDAETGRYVWKLTILQHTFFMNYEQNQTSASQANLSLFQNLPDNFNESREDLISDDKPFYNEAQLSSNTNLSMFKNVQNKWLTSSESLINNHLKPGMPLQTSMAFDINLSNNAISTANNYNWNPSGSNASLTNYRAQSTSDVNLSNSNVNLNDSSKERLKLLLPTYRPAPDYETAIQHKYRDRNMDNYLHPDVTQVTNSAHYSDASDYGILQHRFNIPKPPPPYPTNRLSSTSTPDLHHRGLFAYRGIQISGSSPDLVSSRTLLNQSSLIPKYPMNTIYPPNIKQRLRHSHSFLPHATYENLNIIETANPDSMIYRTSSAAGAIAQQMNMEHFLQNRHHRYIMKSLNGLNLSNTHVSEPIYENVPLPLTQYDYELNRVGLQQNVQELTPRLASNPIALARKPPQTFLKTNNNNNNSTNQLFNNNNNNNNNNTNSTSISSFNKEFDINNVSASISSINLSDSMQNNNISTQLKQKTTNNTTQNSANTTFSTESNVTDSSSTCMSGKTKEKRSRIWSILSGGGGKVKSVSSSKQNMETTLRKDKQKSKKVPAVTQDRWSTGLSKGLPLPANISKESLCELLETKLNDSQLALEFERITKRKENASFSCALMEENSNKNIDLNFLPYDDNRVRLTPTKDNKYGYYNASHITSTVGQKQRFYIVAQSAKDNMNANIFWQCVWEADVYLLIQLSDELTYVPNNSDKCLEYGQYQVWREFSQDTNRCITSKLRVYHTQSRRYRSVWHLIYSEWTDQNCPKDVSHFLKFLEEVNSVRLASIQEIPLGHNTNPPVLIHCDEGFERTGVTLVSDLLLYTLDHNQDLDIPRVIGQLRQQRDKIIPSLLQYKFIYSLLIHYLKETRLI